MSVYELIAIILKKRIQDNKRILCRLEPLVITRIEWIMWRKYISYLFNYKVDLDKEMPEGYTIRGRKVVIND
jgi:hypothetical protein